MEAHPSPTLFVGPGGLRDSYSFTAFGALGESIVTGWGRGEAMRQVDVAECGGRHPSSGTPTSKMTVENERLSPFFVISTVVNRPVQSAAQDGFERAQRKCVNLLKTLRKLHTDLLVWLISSGQCECVLGVSPGHFFFRCGPGRPAVR